MKNATTVWLASELTQYAAILNVVRFYSASDFKRSGSVQIKKVSTSAVTPRKIVSEQLNTVVSTATIAPEAAGRLRSLLSKIFSAMRIEGQRSIDQQIRKQYLEAAKESGFNEPDHLEPVDGQPRKEDLERLERYKHIGI